MPAFRRLVTPLLLVVAVVAGCSATTTSATSPVTTSATACGATHPATWMGCLTKADPAFPKKLLTATALPGAHDSGTFDLSQTLFDTQSGSDCTNYSSAFAADPALVTRWSTTQTLDYTGQLDAGVRYLDLRIAYTGNPATGWRLVHTQFSQDPLATDLASSAAWARAHPSDVVVADVQHLCYDNAPPAAADAQLWSDFSALAPLSFAGAVPTATISSITNSRRNVVVVLPSNSLDLPALAATGVHATLVGTAGSDGFAAMPEAYAWASAVAPATPAAYPAANRALQVFPTHVDPPLGSLAGRGLFQAQLIYSLSGSNIVADIQDFTHFSGLITGADPWERGLWQGSFTRNQIVANWGSRLNAVVTDGVQYGGFVPAVVAVDART